MNIDMIKKDFMKHKATYILSLLTTMVWLYQFLRYGLAATSAINLFNTGALFLPAILADPTQLWRLVTPIFIHIGWTHFLMNTLTLFFIGRQVEAVFGSLNFSLIYILSGIFGNAATFIFSPNSLSAGASTSIFGLFAAIAGIGFFTGHPMLKQIGKTFTILIAINLFFNMFNLSSVNIWSHVGGAVGGLLLAPVFPPKYFKNSVPMQNRILSGVTVVVLFIVFLILPFIK